MVLTDEQVTSFQSLYKKNFGEEISKEQAYTEAVKLIQLVQAVYKPIKKEDYEKLTTTG